MQGDALAGDDARLPVDRHRPEVCQLLQGVLEGSVRQLQLWAAHSQNTLDLRIVRRDELRVARHSSVDSGNEYFRSISSGWSDALRHAFVNLPEYDWLGGR